MNSRAVFHKIVCHERKLAGTTEGELVVPNNGLLMADTINTNYLQKIVFLD
jgi:hypothetical protein